MIPLAIAVAIMIPRLARAEFGLFDDGVSLDVEGRIRSGAWVPGFEAGQGRFRPLYWLFFAGAHGLSGGQAAGHFAVNLLLLMVTALLLMKWVRRSGRGARQAWITAGFFVLAGPVIESYYTLSKGEALQVLLFISGLLLAASWTRTTKRTPVLAAGMFSAWLLADLTKETSLVLLPIFGLEWIFHEWRRRRAAIPPNPRVSAQLATAVAAAIVFFALQFLVSGQPLFGGNYSGQYDIGLRAVSDSAVRWAGWLLRDYSYLLPLGVFAILRARRARIRPDREFEVGPLIWMAGWVGIYLPWVFAVEYYLLPFSLGAAILSGEWMVAVTTPGQVEASSPASGWQVSVTALTVLLASTTVLSSFNSARLQVLVDDLNARMLERVARLAPRGGLVMINLPADNEYVYEIGLHLSGLWARPDLLVDRLTFPVAEAGGPESLEYWVLSPWIEDSFSLSVRLGVFEEGTRTWNQALDSFLNMAPIWSEEGGFGYNRVDLPAALCFLTRDRGYCQDGVRVWESGELKYGWDAYAVVSHLGARDLPASFQAGTWEVLTASGIVRVVRFGAQGDIPLVGDWDGDGYDGIGVVRPAEGVWLLDNDLDGAADVRLQVDGMVAGDLPVAGDWNGDGRDSTGWLSPASGEWTFLDSLDPGPGVGRVPGLPVGVDSIPLAADWDGDGRSGIGLYRFATGEVDVEDHIESPPSGVDLLGPPGQTVVSGDWAGFGWETLAFVSGGVWHRLAGLCDCPPSNSPRPMRFGGQGDFLLAGRWPPQGLP
ncbi:MAG: hypothetical protein WD906_07870 [Anaerolineales bacterium]